MARRRGAALGLFLAGGVALALAVGWFGLRVGLDLLNARAQSDLALAADRLTGQLQRYRDVTVLAAEHPALLSLPVAGSPQADAASAVLERVADGTGSSGMLLMDMSGQVRAGTAHATDYAAEPGARVAFARALQGAMGFAHAVSATDGAPRDRAAPRDFYFAAPVFADTRVIGAVITRLGAAKLESRWRGEAEAVFFTDAAGVVFVSNRDELLDGVQGSEGALRPFLAHGTWHMGGHEVWTISDQPYLPVQALHLKRDLPVVGLAAEILIDAGPVLRTAALQMAMAAALWLSFGAVLFALAQRRRAMAARLQAETRANRLLERRVENRTRDLSLAVERLRREVQERTEAQAALTRAQDDLVQAGKMAALGQMSAGLAHELNQPLMAIGSYAENARTYLDRNDPATAQGNLARITDLARRMGRIIRNLRAFSRQSAEPASPVDLVAVVEAVLELASSRIAQSGVALDWAAPDAPVLVMGGEVRLQQVVMNLCANALDAMEGRADPRLTIRLAEKAGHLRLTVRDTGPGIPDAARMFDPFFSTKEVGRAEGMGLGLSISYSIVTSFGGSIAGANLPGGGAEFTVDLIAAAQAVAA